MKKFKRRVPQLMLIHVIFSHTSYQCFWSPVSGFNCLYSSLLKLTGDTSGETLSLIKIVNLDLGQIDYSN